jgi:hypothetical protein
VVIAVAVLVALADVADAIDPPPRSSSGKGNERPRSQRATSSPS